MRALCRFWVPLLCIAAVGSTCAAKDFSVSSPAEISAAMLSARAGDTLTMSAGIWNNVRILFQGNGSDGNPILLRAPWANSVTITGASNLQIAGSYLVVDGLTFTQGYCPSGGVVDFRGGSPTVESHHCRLTNTSILDFNPDNTATEYKWVSLYGHDNRVDHCLLRGKNNAGATLVVWLSAIPNYHRIDQNYFGRRPDLGVNGGETIRIGTSDWSMYDSFAIVEQNLFEECNGEIEIISNKSCGNIYRNNTFRKCQGTLTLRHGNRCRVEGNFFFGNGISSTGGIRVIGEDHTIVNNYVGGTKGTSLRAAISVMDGIQDSPLNGYYQVKRATIAFNTLVDNTSSLDIGAGKDSDNVLPPVDCVLANNLIVSSAGPLVRYTDVPVNITWEGNIAFGAALGLPSMPGITVTNPNIGAAAPDGMRRPLAGSPVIDAATGSYPWVAADIDGQKRDTLRDVGADEASTEPVQFVPLTGADVGPQTGTTGIHGELRTTTPGQRPLLTAYPNPFNPGTCIEYWVPGNTEQGSPDWGPGSSWVKLSVYDLLGREVETLVNEEKSAGSYAVFFDGSRLSSGMYLSRLATDGSVTIRKILRVR